jgi:membrane protease YdiL (CAAX protease family)
MESSDSAAPVQQSAPRYLAPWWHTIVLVLFLLGFSALGSKGHPGLDHSMRLKLYSSTIVLEWIMVLFIAWGLHKGRQTNLRELVGGRWATAEDFLMDIVFAFGFWFLSLLVLLGVGYLLRMNSASELHDAEHRIGAMLPQGKGEVVTWLLLCVTAGVCEEIIFRGYFQKQFGALLNSACGGVVLQAMIFGGSHAYEGWKKMIQIAVFGSLFGILALWRKNLRPGMMMHFAQDSVAGLFGRWAIEHAGKVMPK